MNEEEMLHQYDQEMRQHLEDQADHTIDLEITVQHKYEYLDSASKTGLIFIYLLFFWIPIVHIIATKTLP